jgi:hypothetical protein
VTHFNHAIRLEPEFVDALCDRADAYLALSRSSDALASAHKACSLSFYRRVRCLDVLAQAYAAEKVYDQAAYFSQKAAEYSPQPDDQVRLLAKVDEYSRLQTEKRPPLTAIAGNSASAAATTESRQSVSALPPGDSAASAERPAARPYYLRTFIPRSLSASGR